MIPPFPLRLTTWASACLLALPALAAESTLAPIEVTGHVPALSGPETDRGFTGSAASQQNLATHGGPAQSNPYRALELMPSVNLNGADAYGLTVEQNFLRIRGISAYTYSNLAMSIDGVPSTVNVGNGGMGNLWDLENLSGVSLARGAMPADKGLGFGNLAGAMDLSIRAPAEHASAMVRLATGSEDFRKRFVRLDSGELGAGTRFFLSTSDAQADKWRGPGEQHRRNLAAGLHQDLGERGSLDVYAVHNDFTRHEYRPLSYAQSQDLGQFARYDYAAGKSGNAALGAQYYDYNRQDFAEDSVQARLSWQLGADTTLRLKPYWSKTEGYRLTASGSNVMRMDIDQEQLGVIGEVQTRLAGHTLLAGWWTQRIETIPPPLSQKVYGITTSGDLNFARWAILADMGKRQYDSPYLSVSGEHGALAYTVGARYLRFTLPGITSYNGTGIGDIARADALARGPALNPALSTQTSTFDALLPSLSLQWRVSPQLDARLAAGRTVGNPWVGPLYSTYMNNTSRFQAAGIGLQKLWSSLRLEKADTLDLGASWRQGGLTLAPTLYYTRFTDKQVTAFDPAVGVAYPQSGVSAHAYGAELEAVWRATPALSLVGSLSWNVNKLDDNIQSGAGAQIATQGKQTPDTPQWLAKLGLSYQHDAWQLSPMLRYVGKRYGDALNSEKVAGYAMADLHASYTFGRRGGFAWLELGASVLNLFDKRYISIINVGQDDARPGATGYYPGAPRTWMLSLSGGF